jgi:hypothetical protein
MSKDHIRDHTMSSPKFDKSLPTPKHWMTVPFPYEHTLISSIEEKRQRQILGNGNVGNLTDILWTFPFGEHPTWTANATDDPVALIIHFPDPLKRFSHSLADLPLQRARLWVRAFLRWETDPARKTQLLELSEKVLDRRSAEYKAHRDSNRALPFGGVLYCKDSATGESDLCVQSEEFPTLTPFESLNLSQMDDHIRHVQRIASLMITKRRLACAQFAQKCADGSLFKSV